MSPPCACCASSLLAPWLCWFCSSAQLTPASPSHHLLHSFCLLTRLLTLLRRSRPAAPRWLAPSLATVPSLFHLPLCLAPAAHMPCLLHESRASTAAAPPSCTATQHYACPCLPYASFVCTTTFAPWPLPGLCVFLSLPPDMGCGRTITATCCAPTWLHYLHVCALPAHISALPV